MKKMKNLTINILAIAFVFLSVMAIAQDNRTLDTKIADLLAQMPTKDLAHRDRLMGEMMLLGPDGFQKMAAMLQAPGKGDDTPVRFAINSFARYASQPWKPDERNFAENSLIKAIENQSDKDVKSFLMEELYLVATDNSVNAVKKYLTDERLSNPAILVMTVKGGGTAGKAFLEALPQSGDNTKVGLLKALGDIRCKNAVTQVTEYAKSSNPAIKKAAMGALAAIGDPVSYKLLSDAALNAGFGYDNSNATGSFLDYTESLGRNNELVRCRQACELVFSKSTSPANLHNYSSALAVYTKYFGYEAMPVLLKAFDNNDKPFRKSVLNLANQVKDIAATRKWIEKARLVSPELKADIVEMLGKRGDLSARKFIEESLASNDEIVGNAAVSALVSLTGRDAVSSLVTQLGNGKNTEASKAGLMQLLDQKHIVLVGEYLDKSKGDVLASFIDLVSAKSGKPYFSKIYGFTGSDDPVVKKAAFKALKNLSSEVDLSQLVALLAKAKGEEADEVQKAIIAAASGSEAEKSGKGIIAQALKTSADKEKLIAILPFIGGKANLKTVTDYFVNSSGSLKEASFGALMNWKEYDAASSLIEICKASAGDYRTKALAGFISLVSKAQIPDDQKLLQYRKAMPFAATVTEKRDIIKNTGRLKTFLSLVFLNNYFDDNDLQQDVAQAVMNIAMPGSDGESGFSGNLVKEMLEKTIRIIKGDDSEYYKINIKKYLDALPDDAGFVSMFNGKNLDGWQGLVENPVTRAKMTSEELAKKQLAANKKMTENWSVRDNTIVFSGKGDNLCSIKKYGDFEMIVDWRITKEGDSGIYLRGTPQVQIWDTSRVDVGAQVGSGGLYNNQKNPSKPLKLADNAIGDWNTFRITMIGDKVTVYLNGELVVDNVTMENYWDRAIPVFPVEAIELQAHGTDLAFRDIYVHEINTKLTGLTKEEIKEGFESLFNGRNLNGWQGNLTDYFADNGEMVVQPTRGGHGNIYTEKEYSDFVFRFDFQLTPGANNGLGVRAPLEGDAAYVGMEIQILDNTAPIYANLHEYQYHGSVYGVIPAKREYLKPVGEWNSEEVTLTGSKVKVVLNGVTIVDGDINEASKNGTLDGKDHPGLKRDKGYIGFLGHGSDLKFRNLRIKDLSK